MVRSTFVYNMTKSLFTLPIKYIFPQQARWRVTSKEALAQISKYSDAGITVRGTYYPPGKTVPEGDRKLFLAIESTNELSVQKAKVEITRLLKEELLKLQTSGITLTKADIKFCSYIVFVMVRNTFVYKRTKSLFILPVKYIFPPNKPS